MEDIVKIDIDLTNTKLISMEDYTPDYTKHPKCDRCGRIVRPLDFMSELICLRNEMFKFQLTELGREMYKGGNIKVMKPVLDATFSSPKEAEQYILKIGSSQMPLYELYAAHNELYLCLDCVSKIETPLPADVLLRIGLARTKAQALEEKRKKLDGR